MRAVALATCLAVAAALVVVGVSLLSVPAAWIVAGFLLAGLSVLLFAEVVE